MDIVLTIDIDGERAAELNQFQSKLEATLILHVGLGKEHFVPVSAIYGTSLRFSLRLQFFWGWCVRVVLGIYAIFLCVIRANVLCEHPRVLDAA